MDILPDVPDLLQNGRPFPEIGKLEHLGYAWRMVCPGCQGRVRAKDCWVKDASAEDCSILVWCRSCKRFTPIHLSRLAAGGFRFRVGWKSEINPRSFVRRTLKSYLLPKQGLRQP
ncbi:hypothetical protein ACSSVV_001507 [Marinobacter sp. MBR-105]|jgi:hypothetical protein